MNPYAIVVSAVVPLILGALWFSPALFGKIWMNGTGKTESQIRQGSMPLKLALTFVFGIFVTLVLHPIVVHQFGAFGMIGGAPEDALPSFQAFMDDYGSAYRTFKHGALHGFITGLMFVFPVIAILGLFENKPWSYILVNTGYWVLSTTIMGAIICGWVN